MKIAVIGVGTVGIMSLCHTLRWVNNYNTTITSIYDPSIKILGIGESAEPGFCSTLFEGTGFTLLNDADELDATLKLGATWKNWRNDDFDAFLHPPSYGIHFNNFRIKEFAFTRFKKLWGDKFQILEGTVSDLSKSDSSASVTVNEINYEFDYIIDCRGYPDDYNEYNVIDLSVNCGLVYTKSEPGTWNTTITQATKNGWMFGIPLKSRQGWGYLYNDTITSEEDAIDDIQTILDIKNPKLSKFKFKSYYAKQFFDGRILKNGNRALFFEPLEALSGFVYNNVLRNFIDYITGTCSLDDVNLRLTTDAIDTENFIRYLYQGGSTFNSNFWSIVPEQCKIHLSTNDRWNQIISELQNCYQNGVRIREQSIASWHITHWEMWERNLRYRTF